MNQTRDPVCGMMGREELSYEYAGRTFYFCSALCRKKFVKSPETYIKHSLLSEEPCVTAGRDIAYFSMEIGIEPSIPTYSGGLGVLAGDTIRSAADLKVPMVAVTLL